jgi:hypothetical protein
MMPWRYVENIIEHKYNTLKNYLYFMDCICSGIVDMNVFHALHGYDYLPLMSISTPTSKVANVNPRVVDM